MITSARRSPRSLPGRALRVELLENRQLLAIDTWQNPVQPLDVNDDAFVSPLDSLIVINAMNQRGIGDLVALFGAPGDYYYDTNGDGLLTPLDALRILNRLNQAQGGPKLQAALANDTGLSATDRITSDPTVDGVLIVPAGFSTLKSFTASLNGSALKVNLLPHTDQDGNFRITLDTLLALNGNLAVPDGSHTLNLRAVDELGLAAVVNLPFKLDRVALTPGTPALTADSDSGSSQSDGLTNITTPRFNLTAEAGAHVQLFANDLLVAEGPAGTTLQVPAPLADGIYSMRAKIIDVAGNVSALSAASALQILTAPPTINLEMLPFTADVTPDARVWIDPSAKVAAATSFVIDVDLNDDGKYDGPGELNYTTGTLFKQTGVLQQELPLSKPLPRADVTPYYANIRARVVDLAGNEGFSDVHRLFVSTGSSNVLHDYINLDDSAYQWNLISNFTVNNPGLLGGAFTVYVIDLKSQRWRNPEDFGEPTSDHPLAFDQTLWQHYLTIFVPAQIRNDSALLLISGGSYQQAPLTPADFNNPNSQVALLGQQAALLGSMTVYLPVVPRENMRFADETRTRTEDAIIAYSYDKFLDEPLGTNSDWPLLLAMAKSAVKAMDATQEFVAQYRPDLTVDDFVVTGGSKRGWTTWLTAAADTRVRAIMPMVFDALNLGQQMVHHYGVYDAFSYAIQDYEEAQVFERILTDRGRELGQIVDPYSYLHNGNFQIPKLIINSAGDEFFVTDSAQYYFHDLPGNSNYLLYLANTGHGLDYDAGQNSKTVRALTTFYDAVVNNKPLPKFTWQVLDNGSLRVQTTTQPTEVVLWQGTNPAARDFRNATTTVTWTSSTVTSAGSGIYVATIPAPPTGATAFFMELVFPSTLNIGGIPIPFRFTTEVVVSSNEPFAPWPFEVGSGNSAKGLSAAALPALTSGSAAIVVNASMIDNLQPQLAGAASLNPLESGLLAAVAELTPSTNFELPTTAAPPALPDEPGRTHLRQTSLGSYGDPELSDLIFAEDVEELLSVLAG